MPRRLSCLNRMIRCPHIAGVSLGVLYFWLSSPFSALGYKLTLYQAAEVYSTNTMELNAKIRLTSAGLIIEDFEDEDLIPELAATVGGRFHGSDPSRPNPNAWDGEWTSTSTDAVTFTVLVPNMRMFGVG